MFANLMKSAAVLAAVTLGVSAQAAFVTPTAGDVRFGWDRFDAGSAYSEWDVFTIPLGAPGNLPDVDSFGVGSSATVTQTVPGAFIAGSGNIYSFGSVNDFDVSIPLVIADYIRVVVQVQTLGTELVYDDILIDGLAPVYTEELDRIGLGGFGGSEVETLLVFDLPFGTTGPVNLDLTASGTSLSLDQLVVDVFGQSTAFPAVPEPASLALLAGGLAVWVRRSRPTTA
ncbi:MAG: PEP-CTERM sorting domain-containing protein [Planctomycetota bacterium]